MPSFKSHTIRLSPNPIRHKKDRKGHLIPILRGLDNQTFRMFENDLRREKKGRWFSGMRPRAGAEE